MSDENNVEEVNEVPSWKLAIGKMLFGLVAGAAATLAAEKVWDIAFSPNADDEDDGEDTED